MFKRRFLPVNSLAWEGGYVIMNVANSWFCKTEFILPRFSHTCSRRTASSEDERKLSSWFIHALEQMSPFPTEGEVYRYLTLTHQAIGQAYAKVAAEQDTCSLSRVDGNDIDDTTEQGGGDGGNAASKEHGRPTGLRAVMERFEESSFELHILEKALERYYYCHCTCKEQ